MATQQAAEEAAIRERIGSLAEVIQNGDLQAMKSIYAPDIVSFDVEPPLQHVGEAAKWRNWEHAFTVFQPPLGYEIRDLTITVGGDVAFAHSFNRLSGTLRNGTTTSGIWVRATICLRKVDGAWLIAHDHVSVPLDIATGRGVADLEP